MKAPFLENLCKRLEISLTGDAAIGKRGYLLLHSRAAKL